MFTVLKCGPVISDSHIVVLSEKYKRVILPDGFSGAVELTHWWVINEDGEDFLYVGNEETFANYTKEHNRA